MDTLPAAQAVEALIHEYGRLVFHTIYSLTGDWEESQDLTQDTFHQALKAIDAARAKSGPRFHARAWLLRIALNTVLMQRRRQRLFRFVPFSRLTKREQSDESGAYAEALDDLRERAAAVQPAGYGVVESGDLEERVAEQDAVRRTLARLSEPLRLCLVLSVIGQFSSSEIAAMLKVEEAAVRQRVARARKQFQQLYRLESGEEISDPASQADVARSPTTEIGPQDRQYHTERVEFRGQAYSSRSSAIRREHAGQLYRNPAVAPLR